MADITDKYKGITEGEWDVRELNTNLFHISSEHKHICVIAIIKWVLSNCSKCIICCHGN